MKMRGTATDKLADVLQMLLFVRKTGTLMVQRETSENFVEEGSLFFQDGNIVDATVENLRGADAMKKLSTWNTCYFVFQEQALPENFSRPPSQAFPAVPREQRQPFVGPASMLVPYRSPGYQNSMPNFDRLRLSRAHRQLYLLADGQHSIDILAKLIGRTLPETLSLLSDLENFGLLRRS